MTTLETSQELPLRLTEDGTIRIAGSRVSLDSVVHHYKLGASAEQIAQKFPALDLADVYAAITYYLNHKEAIEEYLREQEAKGDEVQKKIESDPQYQKSRGGSMSKKSTHVVPDPNGGWSVKKAGAVRASKRFDKKQDAITYAKNISKDQGAEFVIHRQDGTIHSIETYGADPNPQ